MKKLILFIVITQFLSCSKSPKCWGEDKSKGIIKASLNQLCFPKDHKDNYVINDTTALFQVVDRTCALQNDDFKKIDFSTETLLGIYASGGCNVKFIREVNSVSSESKYHYKVTVKECGLCKSLAQSYNWVIVPKLPNGWTATFETKNK